MTALEKLESRFKKFGSLFKTMWINPGHCGWIDKMPDRHYFGGIDVLKAKKMPNTPRGTGRKIAFAKAKLIVAGTLTLPVGLPLMLVTLPFVFVFSGLPHLRKKHLDKVQNRIGDEFGLCKGRARCARQIAKLITCIGHPRVENICMKCKGIVEEWAAEAGERIQSGKVTIHTNAITELLEAQAEIWDDQSEVGE